MQKMATAGENHSDLTTYAHAGLTKQNPDTCPSPSATHFVISLKWVGPQNAA